MISQDESFTQVYTGTLALVNNSDPLGNLSIITVPSLITVAQLRQIFPSSQITEAYLKQIADELNVDLAKYKLNTPLRKAHFFAQVKQEAGPLLQGINENLNYPPNRLISKFSYYANHQAEASQDGRTSQHPANQVAIANKAYANRVRNGNVASGDGWNFRGRGLKQVTFRGNYQEFTQEYPSLWSNGVDFESQPDLLSEMPYKVRSAVWFWVKKMNPNHQHCYEIADEGASPQTVNKITRIVNPGELGAQDVPGGGAAARRTNFVLTYSVFS